VDGGTGFINSTPGMERISILEINSQVQKVQRDACTAYTVYRYDVTLRLLNDGAENGAGWLKMLLVDTTKEEGHNIIDTQYVQVDVPAQTVVNNAYKVVFGSGLDQPGRTEVRAEVVVGSVPDSICNGTGRIALNTWPFVNGLKAHFIETVRTTELYTPPPAIDWEKYVFFNQ